MTVWQGLLLAMASPFVLVAGALIDALVIALVCGVVGKVRGRG